MYVLSSDNNKGDKYLKSIKSIKNLIFIKNRQELARVKKEYGK
jgi:hypothetical protein